MDFRVVTGKSLESRTNVKATAFNAKHCVTVATHIRVTSVTSHSLTLTSIYSLYMILSCFYLINTNASAYALVSDYGNGNEITFEDYTMVVHAIIQGFNEVKLCALMQPYQKDLAWNLAVTVIIYMFVYPCRGPKK